MNLYHVTNFSLNLRFTLHFLYLKISCFTLVLSITIVWTVFSRTFSILSNSQLEFDICRKRHSKSLFCLYFIYARKIDVRKHVKITRQWKSTLTQTNKRVTCLRSEVRRTLAWPHGDLSTFLYETYKIPKTKNYSLGRFPLYIFAAWLVPCKSKMATWLLTLDIDHTHSWNRRWANTICPNTVIFPCLISWNVE